MKAQIIQIGNSQGIRIPKLLLEETGLSGEVSLEACTDGIFIRNITKPRSGWEAVFKELREVDDDAISADLAVQTEFDRTKWHW